MFEIDRKAFGAFVAALRKEQGLTQKELAQRLYISDKAVSKWETGASIPDTSLLIPLADILGVTVTELLECRRSETGTTLGAEEAEALVQKALRFSEEKVVRPDRRKNGAVLGGAALLSAAESLVLLKLGYPPAAAWNTLLLFCLLTLFCGSYFWLLAPQRLPRYYDENRITAYSDGFFRMNLVGIAFHNRNWPHILRCGRIWTIASLLGTPVFFGAIYFLFPAALGSSGKYAAVLLVLGGLFIPMCVTAKRHE